MSIVDILRSKDLVDYIEELELQTDGSYRCVCPLHSGAKNPTSFTVFPESNTWRCWSCDESGDIIGFVMAQHQCSFSEAIERLCDHYNLNVSKDQSYVKQQSIAEKNEAACKSYQAKLPTVVEYLRKRGFTDETIATYRFGWSSKLSALTLPLVDRYGRIVSFTYRFFEGDSKYKHGRNNELFDKSTYWFNLVNARKLIKRKGRVWLVEGHLDAASAFQQGEPALAYLGIILSKEQLLSLKVLLQHLENIEVILVPDNDGKAAEKIPKVRQMFLKHWPTANLRVALMGECRTHKDTL